MNPPTDWVSAIAILAAGLVLGGLFFFFAKRRKAIISEDLEHKDLLAKRDAFVAQLRDTSINADERARLEHEAAQVLRKLDSHKSPLPAARGEGRSEGAPSSTMTPSIKGFLWGAGSIAALAALGYFVMQSSTARQDGGSLTGGQTAQQQPMQTQQPDAVLAQLEGAVQRDPSNLALRNDLAQAYLERDNLMAVFEQTKLILDKSPNDSRALTYQALVRLAMGDSAAATQMLQQATKSNPKNLDGWVALAWVHAQTGNMAEAEKMIAEAARQSPNDKARLDQVLAAMQQQAKPSQTAQGSELPEGHPPIEGAAPAPSPSPSPAASEGPSVQVTLDLDPSAAQKTGILFVLARNPAGGPPVAVKRMQVASFPVTLQLGSADSMMGQQLPAKFRLEARLDSDGDAATKPPTDPSAVQNDVTPGAVVKLALK